MANSSLLFLGVLSIVLNLVSCTEVNIASPTPSSRENLGRAPEPTSPAILVEKAAELVQRDVYNTLCGYVSGELEYPVTCGGGYICATQAYYNVAGCCNPDNLENCLIADTCIPYGYTCDEACQESYAAYTSCGYLAPYCFTKYYNYGAGYYEYDCATVNGLVTIEASASNAPVTQYVVTTAAVVTQTKASTAAATAVADSSGSVTNIYNGNNDCQSNCGTGNSNGGSGNNVGNNKSGSRTSVPPASLGLRLLSAIYVPLLMLL